jgi:hypothetical protein
VEWSQYDPDRGEETKWWTIDPETGQPDGEVRDQRIIRHCLGDSVLDEVGMSGDAIATTFATKSFSDEEVIALIMERALPRSFQGGAEDAAELLDLVDRIWESAQRCYQQALGRVPTDVERRWLCAAAIAALRARDRSQKP